jgi:hypothetical protein
MKIGDFASMHAENNEIWYGEIVGVHSDTIEVYFIEKGDGTEWSYSEEWHEVPRESVITHVDTSSHSNVVGALKEIGFRPLTDSTFARLHEEGVVPVGDPAFDNVEDDISIGIHPEMQDFIVPDSEGEAFSFANADNEFVRDTHQAVRDFNNWVPKEDAVRIKMFIEGMDEKACALENNRTRLGEGLSYNNPPK